VDPRTPAPSPPAPSSAATRPRPSRRIRWLGGLLALALLAGLGWLAWALTHQAPDADAAGPGGGRRGATTVGVATAERADIPVVLEALGSVVPAATVTVRPQVGGVLKRLLFSEGQVVQAGQLLAEIDPKPFEMALMQATGQRQRDEAQLENARLSLARFRTLLEQDSIARQEVDTQAALVKQLEGTLTTNRANEGTARLNLGYSRVVAPIAGRVGLRTVDPGNVVNPGDAAGLAVITQLSPIDVQFAVPQDQVAELQAQARAAGPGALPATALDRTRTVTLDSGSFTALDNVVDAQTGTVRAKARFPNDKASLFPNQFVNLRLQVRTLSDAVVVPVAALRHGANGDYVYVLNEAERTVSLRKVTRGQASADKVQLTTGLQAGERVITEGADRLKDGGPVVLPGEGPASGPGGGRRSRREAPGGAEGASAPASAASPGEAASQPRRQRRASEASGG
jgi:multidrug efflux system membrane fusion protein